MCVVQFRKMEGGQKFAYYTCNLCKNRFETEKQTIKHIKRYHGQMFKETFRYNAYFTSHCAKCSYTDHSKQRLLKHYAIAHLKYHICNPCNKVFTTQRRLLDHLDSKHLVDETTSDFFDYENVMNRFIIRRANFKADVEKSIPMLLYIKYREAIKNELKQQLDTHNFIRVMFTLHCVFEKIDAEGKVISRETLCITSGQLQHFTYYNLHNFKSFMAQIANHLNENLDSIETTGSGMIMKYISDLDIRIAIPSFFGGCFVCFVCL